MPASSELAPAWRRLRTAGSFRFAIRSSWLIPKISRHPGSPSRIAPCSNDSRSCKVWGSVSATSRPPRAAIGVRGRELVLGPLGAHRRDAEHVPVGGAARKQ